MDRIIKQLNLSKLRGNLYIDSDENIYLITSNTLTLINKQHLLSIAYDILKAISLNMMLTKPEVVKQKLLEAIALLDIYFKQKEN